MSQEATDNPVPAATLWRESLALVLLAVSVLLSLALFSYTAADPSLNHATQHEPENILGLVGSYLADIWMQLLGYASWLLVLLALTLSYRLAKHVLPAAAGWTSLFWLPFVLAVAGLLAAYADAEMYTQVPAGLGGALGSMFAQSLSSVLYVLGRDLVLWTLLLSSFVVASHISLLAVFKQAWLGVCWLCFKLLLLLQGIKTRVALRIKARKERLKGREERKEEKKKRPVHIAESEPEIIRPEAVEIAQRVHIEEHQPQLDLGLGLSQHDGEFVLPSLSLFTVRKADVKTYSAEVLQAMSRMLEKKLLDYKVEGTVVAVQPGPVVIQFEFELSPGTKVSKVIALQDDLARSMSAHSVRVAGNIPGKNAIGIELPNEEREMVFMRDVLASKTFASKKHILPLALGVDIAGQPVVTDLAKMPHLLVAGTTGSGKSVSVNTMICSMLMTHTPEHLRLIMVDPKMLELSMYDDIPHLLVPVVTNPNKAAKALAWAVYEMDRRYRLMSESKVRNIAGFNKAAASNRDNGEIGEQAEHMPYIVILIDELADLMMVAGKEVEQSICRLAQKARAAGLHLILATQRPSVDVITGLIKANLPSRLAFQVSSKIDSRTILDQMGAEQLLGHGDGLLSNLGKDLIRVHGAFIDDDEVIALVEHLKKQGEPDYRMEVFDVELDGEAADGAEDMDDEKDSKYNEAADLIAEKGKCSVSMVQRYLRIGYNRASRIVEQMERDGLVTPPGAGGQRKVLSRSVDDAGFEV
ncbi:MAG: DNA translocase FtsK 4TM domain-containing protein [Mariprofundaceae bacterium]|nr:DNA translocase FtsK 4TM domain-containing protein [Mariprofundaceae bacterium]